MDELAAQIEPHIPALRRYAWGLLHDDGAADDLVQDCLERAITRWHLRRRDGELRAWLFTILHNQFVSGLRQRTRRGPHLGIEAVSDQPASEAGQERHLIARDALAALGTLPEEQRALLLLVGVEDLSYQETAQVLGVPLGTVMSRLSRARDALRRATDSGGAVLRRIK